MQKGVERRGFIDERKKPKLTRIRKKKKGLKYMIGYIYTRKHKQKRV
jgi:hypothetical protein